MDNSFLIRQEMIRTTKDNIFEFNLKMKTQKDLYTCRDPCADGRENKEVSQHARSFDSWPHKLLPNYTSAWPIYSNSFLNNPLFSLCFGTWEATRLSSVVSLSANTSRSCRILYRMKTNLLLLRVKTSVAKPFWRAALFAANNILPKRFILLHWVFFFSNSLQPPVYSRNLWMYSLLL